MKNFVLAPAGQLRLWTKSLPEDPIPVDHASIDFFVRRRRRARGKVERSAYTLSFSSSLASGFIHGVFFPIPFSLLRIVVAAARPP